MPGKKQKLSLLENSHSFLREAVKNAIAAQTDHAQWPFAILNLVQAVELSLKELLRRQHPILIYDDVDNPKNTVSIINALKRLQTLGHSGREMLKREESKIKKVVELRNLITHFEFEIGEEHAIGQFSEMFAFLSDFQRRHLDFEIDSVLPSELLDAVVGIKRCSQELEHKAKSRMEEEGIDPDFIWPCPNCLKECFVIQDHKDVCYLCRYSEEVVECAECQGFCFASDVTDFFEGVEVETAEETLSVLNHLGYTEFLACSDCLGKVRKRIAEHIRAKDKMVDW